MLNTGKLIGRLCMLALIVFVTSNLAIADDSQALDKKDVPDKVLSAFKKAYSDAEVKSIEMEKNKGFTYYEFEIKDGQAERDIVYSEDGSLYAIEEEISSKDIPSNIIDALKKAHPKGEIDEVDKITRGSEIEFEVIIEIEEADKEVEYEVLIASNGDIKSSIQIVDDDQGDVEDDEEEGNDQNNDEEDDD